MKYLSKSGFLACLLMLLSVEIQAALSSSGSDVTRDSTKSQSASSSSSIATTNLATAKAGSILVGSQSKLTKLHNVLAEEMLTELNKTYPILCKLENVIKSQSTFIAEDMTYIMMQIHADLQVMMCHAMGPNAKWNARYLLERLTYLRDSSQLIDCKVPILFKTVKSNAAQLESLAQKLEQRIQLLLEELAQKRQLLFKAFYQKGQLFSKELAEKILGYDFNIHDIRKNVSDIKRIARVWNACNRMYQSTR